MEKHRTRCGKNKQRNASARVDAEPKGTGCFGSRKLLNHANEGSNPWNFSPTEERADIGKDDVVEARKWIPNTPYIINTRARRCACIFIRLAAIKASNCIIVFLDSRRRFILVDLSAKIIKHDHVVLNAQGVEQVKHSL